MNVLDILITSPQYSDKKSVETTQENLFFGIRGYRVKTLFNPSKQVSTNTGYQNNIIINKDILANAEVTTKEMKRKKLILYHVADLIGSVYCFRLLD